MNASRTQHCLASTAILLVALTVGWLSFTQEPADAFLFPRMISIFFMALALWNFIRAVSGLARVGEGLDKRTALYILPGTVVVLIYIFWAAKTAGFYTSSIAAFLAIYTIYDPTPPSSLGGWLRRILVTGIFILVIFGLFAELLQVQTPRGWYDGAVIQVLSTILSPLRFIGGAFG